MERELDPAINYVTATGGLYGGHTLVATHPVKIVEGEPSKPGEFTAEQAQHLLNAGKILPATDLRPTPVERPEDAVVRLSDVEEIENSGEFLIRAPWLPEGSETVKGRDEAAARLVEVRDEGLTKYRETIESLSGSMSPANAQAVAAAEIEGSDGFSITDDGSNGYYTITGPGDVSERIRGKANAEKRLAELRAEASGSTLDPTIEKPAGPTDGPAPQISGSGQLVQPEGGAGEAGNAGEGDGEG